METNNQRPQPQEQMSWVDYCDSLGNEHSWPKMRARPPVHIRDRMPDATAGAHHKRERATELA